MITAFSYSRWQTWKQCPRKAFYQYVEKIPVRGPKSPALERGILVHEACAAIYRGGWSEAPELNTEWKGILAKHKSFYGTDLEAELEVAFDANWEQTKWFSAEAKYRLAFDGFAYTPARSRTLQVYEHKTGKKYTEAHAQQAGWYAGVGSLLVPDAQEIVVDINYLDFPAKNPTSVMRLSYSNHAAANMLTFWKTEADLMFAATDFPTRAGYHCRWCPFANSNGGPCSLG